MGMSWQELVELLKKKLEEIKEWNAETFPDATPEGQLAKLDEEFGELDEAKTKEVLEKAKTFVAEIFGKSHEEAEELAKKYAEELGIKLGDFMMPVRMAVTGSRVSPPLIGSIWILGKEKAVARVEKTLATF